MIRKSRRQNSVACIVLNDTSLVCLVKYPRTVRPESRPYDERNYIRRFNVPPDNEVDDRAHPGLLSCFEFKTFWISWQGGEVRVGHGYDINDISSVFVLWTDPSPFDVEMMGIRTGFGSNGTWIFNKTYQTGVILS
jgi:hypothetical protein